jgi:hypothetical protein
VREISEIWFAARNQFAIAFEERFNACPRGIRQMRSCLSKDRKADFYAVEFCEKFTRFAETPRPTCINNFAGFS